MYLACIVYKLGLRSLKFCHHLLSIHTFVFATDAKVEQYQLMETPLHKGVLEQNKFLHVVAVCKLLFLLLFRLVRFGALGVLSQRLQQVDRCSQVRYITRPYHMI